MQEVVPGVLKVIFAEAMAQRNQALPEQSTMDP
jgi:hypothetical protein